MIISKRNVVTGQLNQMDLPVTEEQIIQWQRGELVQSIFNKLTPDQREFLLSGMLPGEWEKLLGPIPD